MGCHEEGGHDRQPDVQAVFDELSQEDVTLLRADRSNLAIALTLFFFGPRYGEQRLARDHGARNGEDLR
jgi:hypothetical protein